MSMRYPGGLIASSPVNAAYPSGVWTQAQTQPYAAQNVWMRDQYWPNTTLLLQGNGTNGAQNNTFLDSSTNNFTITRNGNTTQGSFTPYEANGYWSNYFGGSQSINAASSSSFQLTGDFTIECWVFRTATGDASVYLQNSGSNYFALNVNAGTGFNIYLNSGSPTISPTDIVPATNVWNHVALVRSGSTVKVYLNGVASATTATNSSTLGYNAIAYVGGFGTQSGGSTVGYISNARVVTSAVYTSNFAPPAAPLTAISGTVLLTCQSNRFIDNSTNAFAITVNGDTSVQAFQPFPGATTWSGSVLGGSGYFDGSGDYLGLQDSNSAYDLGAGTPFTVECWFYSTQSLSATTSYNLIQRGGGTDSWSTSSGIQFALYTYGGQIEWDFNTSGSPTTVVSTAGVVANTWYHVAVSYNGTTTALFLNGSRQATTTASYTFPTTRNIARIGTKSAGTTPAWQGYISDMRVVNGTAIYDPTQTTLTVPTAPLTAVTNTKLLCNFTNAGIFDSAMMNDLETVGNAQVSTSVVKYGTGSMAFDGSGDYLKVPITSRAIEFKTGDFTVEGWFYNTASWSSGLYDLIESDNNFAFYMSSGNFRVTLQNQTAVTVGTSSGLSSNAWHHIALVKSSGNLYLYKNGILDSTGAVADARNYGAEAFKVGTGADGTYTGYIDDLRITKGAARYIGNFTPPVARMPGQ